MSILVVFTGLPATGKSSVAALLLDQTAGLHLSTDETRERLFPREIVGEEVKYGSDASKATYDDVEGRARAALAEGRSLVILDGTYLRTEDRARAIELGLESRAEVLLLEIEASPSTIEARLAKRRPGAEHHSEAGLAVYRDFLTKLSRRDGSYSHPDAGELRKWKGRSLVGASYSTDRGSLRVWFGVPTSSMRTLLVVLDSGFAG